MSKLRCLSLGFTLLLLVPVGCKKTVTAPRVEGLQFTAPEKNHQALAVTVSMRSPEGLIARAADVSAALGLPTTAADIRTMALARSDVPVALLEPLDLSRPVAMVFVARDTKSPKGDPHAAVALSARSADAANKFIAALGTELSRKENAREIKRANGEKIWVVARQETLVLSETLEGLIAAGAHAIATRDSAKEDLRISFFPDGLAASAQADLKTKLAELRKEFVESAVGQASAQGGNPEAMRKYMDATFSMYSDWVLETRVGDLVLSVDDRDGVRLQGRVHAKKGTPLEKRFAENNPATLDPAIANGSNPALIGAYNLAPQWIDSYVTMFSGLVGSMNLKDAPSETVLRDFFNTMPRAMSVRMDSDGKRPAISMIGRKKGLQAEPTFKGWAQFLGSGFMDTLLKAGGAPDVPSISWQSKDTAGVFAATYPKKPKSEMGRQINKMVTAIFGEPRIAVTCDIRNEIMAISNEPGSRARIEKMHASLSAPLSPEIKELVDETRGMEGFMSVDILAMVKMVTTSAGALDPSAAQVGAMMNFIPGLDKLPVPIIFGYRGGEALVLDMHIPMRTVRSVGSILGPLRGMGIGGPPGGALEPGP
jgi:hypothetical protein